MLGKLISPTESVTNISLSLYVNHATKEKKHNLFKKKKPFVRRHHYDRLASEGIRFIKPTQSKSHSDDKLDRVDIFHLM